MPHVQNKNPFRDEPSTIVLLLGRKHVFPSLESSKLSKEAAVTDLEWLNQTSENSWIKRPNQYYYNYSYVGGQEKRLPETGTLQYMVGGT